MVRKDRDALEEYLLDTLMVAEKRIPTAADDFGDPQTVGLHLKRQGYSIEHDHPEPFGRYLGQHSDGYVVAVSNVFDFVGAEVYNTLDELKQEWQLD